MLEEVDMAPSHQFAVVGRAVSSAKGRAAKATAGGEVDLDVKPAGRGIEFAARGRQRRHRLRLAAAGRCRASPSLRGCPSLRERGVTLAAVKDAARRFAVATEKGWGYS